jgi:O-antigen/teichoic acid export membrane protein
VSQIKKLAGQTAIYGLSSIVGRLLNYLLVPIYTRIFDPAQYGVVSEFYAIVTFLIVLYTYGLETALFRFSSKSEEKEKVYSNSLFMILFSSSIFSGILILFSSKISNALGYPSNANYIIWFALILAFDALIAICTIASRRKS